MANPYITPEGPSQGDGNSSWGWLYAGAGAVATAATAAVLSRNPSYIYRTAKLFQDARGVVGDMDLMAHARLRKAMVNKLGGPGDAAMNRAAATPAATKALNPRLFSSLSGLIDAWQDGINSDKLRGALSRKFMPRGEIAPGVKQLSVGNIYKSLKERVPSDPFDFHGFKVDPVDAGRLKRAVDLGLVDKKWMVDKGMFMSGDGVVDASAFMPGRWAENLIGGIKKYVPGGSFLTDTVLPLSHFTTHTPDITRIAPGSLKSVGIDPDTIEAAYKVGSDVFSISKGRKVREHSGVNVGPIGNAIARAQAGRFGMWKHLDTDEMKARGHEFGSVTEKGYKALENEWYQGLVGFSPHHSTETALPKQLWNWMRRYYDTDIAPVSTIPGKTPEEVWNGLSWAEQIMVRMKRDVKGLNYLNVKDSGELLGAGTEFIQRMKRMQSGRKWQASGSAFGSHPTSPEQRRIFAEAGEEISESAFNEYYAYTTGDFLKNLAYNAVESPFRIAEGMFGFGLKPDTLNKTIARATVGVPLAGWGMWQGSKYLDYQFEDTTGVSPIKGAVKAYSEAQIFRQNTLNLLGISHATSLAEQITGIDIDSPASIAMRSIGMPLLGAAIGKKMNPGMGRTGFFVGAGLSALTFTDDLTMEAEELRDIYEGRKEIEVRKNRFWSLGIDPFFGGDAAYSRPHMVASIMSDAAYTESQYGSKSEYWKHGTMFPTPSNLFGAQILADPYYYERKHYYDRPYPVTGGTFKDFPIWGSILDASLGEIIKPTKIMHKDELIQHITSSPEWSGEKGLDGIAQRLSLQQIRPKKVVPRIEGTQDDIGHAIYDMTEWSGLKGFLASTMKDKVTGSPDFSDTGARWAEADDIYSKSREYYDMQLGGILGYSEFFRRFVPTRQKQIDYVNPLENQMPSWLPGKRSEFGDTDFIDFHHGDPYTRIPEGEKRLPGAAYEAMRELHSGKEGYYDEFDRMRVLADIAPYSNAFKYYKNIVDDMADEGQLDGTWLEQYKTINGKILGRAGPKFGDVAGEDNDMSLVSGQQMGLADQMLNIRIPWVGSKLMSQDDDPLREYQERVVFDNDFHDWTRPVDSMLLPYIRSQNAYGPASGALGGLGLGLLSRAAGSAVAGPIGATAAAAGFMGGMSEAGRPESEERRRTTEEYFDKLRYLKLRKLEQASIQGGDKDTASRMSMLQKRTMVGLNYNEEGAQFYKSAYSALPKRDRAYLEAFTEADPNQRSDILDTVPTYMQPMLMNMWKSEMQADNKLRDSLKLDKQFQDKQALEYVQSHGGVPDDEWLGWHPDVDLKDVKLRTVQNLGADIHNYGFWGTDERDIDRTKPYIRPLPVRFNTHAASMKALNVQNSMVQYGFTDSFVNMVRNPTQFSRDFYNIQVERDRTGDIISLNERAGARF